MVVDLGVEALRGRPFPIPPAARVGPVTALHRMGKKLRLKKYRAARFFAGSNFCDFSSDPQT